MISLSPLMPRFMCILFTQLATPLGNLVTLSHPFSREKINKKMYKNHDIKTFTSIGTPFANVISYHAFHGYMDSAQSMQ